MKFQRTQINRGLFIRKKGGDKDKRMQLYRDRHRKNILMLSPTDSISLQIRIL